MDGRDIRDIRILLNPSARSGRARRSLARALAAHLPAPGERIEVIESRSPEHFRELTRAAQEEPLDALGIAGGDGTVALALSALTGPNRVPLGLLPVGSGNDFARHLGVPRSLAGALAALTGGRRSRVDCARVEPGGARLCCVASLGLDEMALQIIHGSRFPRSKALNMYASLRGLLAYGPRPLRVSWQGGSFEGEVMFAAVTNTRSYGGGFMLCPDARVDDGLLNLCIVKRSGRLRLLANFSKILTGDHVALPEVVLASSPWVRLESPDGPFRFALDGELPAQATPVDIVCEPRALEVLLPAHENPPEKEA